MSNSEQRRAPIVEALLQYENRDGVSLHVPGHKDGAAYRHAATQDERMAELYSRYGALLQQDVTEVDGTDDLHQPTGVIREAQELAAACFGAEETHFLVGGSSVGNIAALMACCTQPGDLVLVQRNVHKSVLNGLRLAGARAVFLSSRADILTGLLTAPAPETVQQALARYPQAKAVLICSPNYYGLGVDVKSIADVVHAVDVPLIVDEAHGAHYGMHPMLPMSAMQAGADAVVQSTHKMLSGMTMSAMLHIQGSLVNTVRVKQLLTMLQSSSPSYPLMASLDMSRHLLATQGQALFNDGLRAVSYVRDAMQGSKRLQVICVDNALHTQDPFKLVLTDRTGGWSGYELLELLSQQGCVAEMANEQYVVLLFTFANNNSDAERLLRALLQLDGTAPSSNTGTAPSSNTGTADCCRTSTLALQLMQQSAVPFSDPIHFSIYDGSDRQILVVPTADAAGYESAESVVPYPPGIPLLFAGERITHQHVAQLQTLAYLGEKCQEIADPSLQHIRVYDRNQ